MISYRIDVKQTPPLDAAKMVKQADKQIESGLTEMGVLLERLTVEEAPEGVFGGRGGFKGSIFHEGRGTPVREMIVSSTALYAEFVERGRRPGKMPPFEPIRQWVAKKIGGASAFQSGRTRAQQSSIENIFRITWLVARKIGAKGTQGHFPFKKAFERGKPLLEKIAQKMGISIVAEWDTK